MTPHDPLRVVFAAGGTGGHLYPAFAIADALRARGAEIAFVGTSGRLESTLVPKAGFPLYTIASHPLTRKLSFDVVRTIAANGTGTLQSLRLLERLRPDLVIATGGYVCFPFVLAARLRRGRHPRAIALLEPNAVPGLTNRLLAPLVDEVWAAESGVPVRASVRALPPRDEAVARFALDPARKTLVAIGGSQGARSINDAFVALAERNGLPEGWQLLLVTGAAEYERVSEALAGRQHVAVRPYLDDVADAYAAADLLLVRAGASTIAELQAAGKPAVLVPYPFATQDHQAANAAHLEEAGAAVVMTDRELATGDLRARLEQICDPGRLETLTANAARLRGDDPLEWILARVDLLTARSEAE